MLPVAELRPRCPECAGAPALTFRGMFRPWGGGVAFGRFVCPDCLTDWPESSIRDRPARFGVDEAPAGDDLSGESDEAFADMLRERSRLDHPSQTEAEG